MLPFLTLGPLAIPSKPFVFIIGFFAALWLVDTIIDQIDADPEWTRSTAFNAIILGMIGGRLVFAAIHWEASLASPSSVIWPITFGYSLWGAVVSGVLVLAYNCRNQGIPILKMLDALIEPILILLAAWVIGDYLGGPGYGAPSTMNWFPIHPVHLYEVVVILITFFMVRRMRPSKQFDGWVLFVSCLLLAFGFLITLNFRGGSVTIGNGWQINQIAAFFALIITLLALVWWSPNSSKESLTSS
ncbi:MAG: prolipoprotein diacylglyceryl transferase family protein [Chloroflexota bacterium]